MHGIPALQDLQPHACTPHGGCTINSDLRPLEWHAFCLANAMNPTAFAMQVSGNCFLMKGVHALNASNGLARRQGAVCADSSQMQMTGTTSLSQCDPYMLGRACWR